MNKASILSGIFLSVMIIVSADIKTSDIRIARNLGTKTIAHVAIVVNDIEKTTRAYAELFGIDPPIVRLGNSPDYMGESTEGKAKMAFIQLENIILEFFEPVGGPSAWQDFLEKKGEGVNHFGFWIEDLEDHVNYFKSRDMPVIQSGGGDWGRYRYVDASSGLAVMIELMEKKNPDSE